MPADPPLLLEGLVPPWVHRDSTQTGLGRHYGFVLGAFGFPAFDLSASPDLHAGGSTVSYAAITPPRFDDEVAAFAAYGFGNWALFQESGEGSLATYRTCAGSGTHKYVSTTLGGVSTLWIFSLGSATLEGYVNDPDLGWIAADFSDPDTFTVLSGYTGGEHCDESNWTTSDGPWPTFAAGSGPGWVFTTTTATSSISGPGSGLCPASDASATLSEPCQWSDLAAFTASASTKLSGTGFSYGPSAYSTGAGASDGTSSMKRRVARYRIESAAWDRTVRWKIVKRRLLPKLTGTVPTTTLAETENLELIARPYYDELGAWSPTDLAWDEVAEKALAWRGDETGAEVVTAQTSSDGPDGLPNGYSANPRIWASRIRAQIGTGAVHTVRWRVLRTPPGLPTGETFVDSVVTDGFTSPLEFGPETGVTSTTVRIHELIDAEGASVVGATARTLYRSRRLWRTVGWPPFQVGSDPIPAHTFYRRRSWRLIRELNATAAWGGLSTQWHAPCEYRSEVAFYQDYDLTSGRKLERVITVAEDTANEIEFPVDTTGTLDLDGNYATVGEILSGVLARTTATAPATQPLTWPIDHTEDYVSGIAPEEVVELEESVVADTAGHWHYLEAPRGYSLHVEEAAWDTPPWVGVVGEFDVE